MVFAGVFTTLHKERVAVMGGLERYLKAQQARAEELEREGLEIIRLKARAPSEGASSQLDAAIEHHRWAQKIFQARQDNLTIACEVPVRIDQRIFELGKAIGERLKTASGAGAPDPSAPVPQ